MDFESTVYESRCQRCNVSFPIETRSCLHCGGKTVAADQLEAIQMRSSFDFEPDGPFMGGTNAGAMRMPTPGPAEQDDQPLFRLPEFSSAEREIDESDAEPKSIGRTIIRGLGGFIWVIVLIGFTLARNCGED